jgi:hypothetical protein
MTLGIRFSGGRDVGEGPGEAEEDRDAREILMEDVGEQSGSTRTYALNHSGGEAVGEGTREDAGERADSRAFMIERRRRYKKTTQEINQKG